MTTATISPADTKPKVSLKNPGQLLAATPYLLGFRPADSLVMIGHAGPQRKQVGPVLRLDIPAPRHDRDAAELLLQHLVQGDAKGATIAIVGRRADHPPPESGCPPHTGLVETITEVFGEAGRPVLHALWAPEIRGGARWECYQDPACGGVLPDETSTVMAAAAASVGTVTFSSREAMEAQLAPRDLAALVRRSHLLDVALEELVADDDPDRAFAEGRAEVRAALRQVRGGELRLSDEQVVRLAVALSDKRIRDACLSTALPRGGPAAMEAERLWLELVRTTPIPERAEPACLLAYSAYLRGDGTLANMALENALDAHPGHVLAGLLWGCLQQGIRPKRLERIARLDGVEDLFTKKPSSKKKRRKGTRASRAAASP